VPAKPVATRAHAERAKSEEAERANPEQSKSRRERAVIEITSLERDLAYADRKLNSDRQSETIHQAPNVCKRFQRVAMLFRSKHFTVPKAHANA
jgi:hypothetical protein